LVIKSIRSIIEATKEKKKKNTCTYNDAMEIQTLKPGKCSLALDASRIIWGTQQTDFPPDATTTFFGLPTTGLIIK
jgi:hypothetical protein